MIRLLDCAAPVQSFVDLVTVHREGRTSQAPLGGSRKDLDPRDLRRVCKELGLDWSQLPGSKDRV